jgi:hypothetical protein
MQYCTLLLHFYGIACADATYFTVVKGTTIYTLCSPQVKKLYWAQESLSPAQAKVLIIRNLLWLPQYPLLCSAQGPSACASPFLQCGFSICYNAICPLACDAEEGVTSFMWRGFTLLHSQPCIQPWEPSMHVQGSTVLPSRSGEFAGIVVSLSSVKVQSQLIGLHCYHTMGAGMNY